MKKFKLLLAALAAMVGVGVNAQTWTGNAVGAGTFYLYNVGSGLYMGGGTSWGTRATLIEIGIDIELVENGSGYSLDTKLSNGGDNHYFAGEFMDGAATPIYFTETSAGSKTYLMSTSNGEGATYIGYDGTNKAIVNNLTDANSTNAQWKLVTKADREATLSAANTNNGVDATFLLPCYRINRNDTRMSNFTMDGGPGTYNKYDKNGPNYENRAEYAPEEWNNTFDLSQTVTGLPNGVYEISVAGFGRGGRTFLYANDISVPMQYTYSSNYADAMTAILNGTMTIEKTGRFQVTNGQIKFGIKRTAGDTNDWTVFNNFRLTYYGAYNSDEPNINIAITNPGPIRDATGWTCTNNTAPSGSPGDNTTEYWNKSAFSIKQTLNNLPAGYYTLKAVALTRTGMQAKLSANGESMNIATVPQSGGTAGVDYCNGQGDCGKWFSAGNGVNNLTFHLATQGDVEIGLTTDNTTGDHWMVFRNFSMVYHGEYPISITQPLLAAKVAEAESLYASLPTAAKAALKSVVDAQNQTYSTGKQYSDAADAITAAIAVARPIIEPYARFLAVKPNVVALKNQTTKYTDPGTAVSTFDAAVAAQQTAVDEATTVDAIETAIVNLRKAASAFAGNVDIVAGQYLDLTDAMLYNAAMRNSGDLSLWTIVSNTNTDYPKYANNCSEFWKANFDFYQTAYELPAGNYNIEVSAFHRAAQEGSTYHTFLYANSDQVLVLPLANGENNTTQAEASFNNGLYTNSIKITLDNATDVNIGFKNEDTAEDLRESGAATDKWTIFRDFKIKYFGDDALALYRDEYESALAAATEALENATYSNIAGTDRSNLNTAVNTTYPKSVVEVDETQEKFETATAQLTALTTTFKNGVASWNTYANSRAGVAAAKDEADLFDENIYTGLGLTEATTAAEAAAKAAGDEPAIRVATADYVAAKYKFSATGLIGDFGSWTGTATVAGEAATPNYLSSEHWSGSTHAYYEQATTGWGSNSWTIKYEKTCTLPAGSYVIKVAARSSVDVTSSVSCSATTTTISLPKEGAFTRGIKLNGEAGWDGDNSEYARDGQGFGWQWRFLPFELTEQTEVTMTFYAETDKQYNWMSIADGELLSTTKLAEDVAYNETASNTIENTIIADVTMTRTIKEGYNTVVLPFTLTANQVNAAFGANTEVYNYSDEGTDEHNVTVNFTKGDGSITANVPVLVKATSASTEQTFNGVQIVAAEAKTAGTYFDFVGSYAPVAAIPAGDYFIGNGAIYKSEGATSMKAFRAYLQAKNPSSVKSVRLFIEGIATGIEAIDEAAAENNAIFNLAGQRVQKAQRGLYIVNGKKVLVK